MEKDINDAFDDILLCEEKLTKESYEEGFEKGKSEGNPEGYHLGYHRGAEIGAELGYYLGVVKIYLAKEGLSDKVVSNLKLIEEMIQNFPRTNDENVDILALVDSVRGQYRKTCSLLKIDGKFPDADNMNF